jgi:peptidoglycan/xylan/chitin deacetylase (PgdA/CDA1 family)
MMFSVKRRIEAGCYTVMRSASKNLTAIIQFVSAVLYRMFLFVIRRKSPRLIIYYHSVKGQYQARFEKQMEYLARNCNVVKAYEIMRPKAGKRPVVAITFDDAFVNVMENAIPVLKKFSLPASIFVPTGNLGQPPHWYLEAGDTSGNETVMNERQILELDKNGFEILSHTVSHPFLVKLDDGELNAEMIGSRQTLENIVGHAIVGISYPYGEFDTRVCEAAKKAGYIFGFTAEPLVIEDRVDNFRIGRFRVSERDSLPIFRLKVNGAYQVMNHLSFIKKYVIKILNRIVPMPGTGRTEVA